jgi:dephospho-CoA kinase
MKASSAVLLQGAHVSNWPGKIIIGLTGNIATGKSVVRKMLEHLGAYGIDADALSHRAIAKGAPGYQPVVDAFGQWLVDQQGEIDRGKLARLVFNDPEALTRLEDIVHPLVIQAVDVMIQRAGQKVIVVEAIKLLEGSLRNSCDAIWVTTCPEETQIARLFEKRNFSRDEAIQRIHSQGAQEIKLNAASVIVKNEGSFEDTWKQVVAAWKKLSPQTDTIQVVKKVSGDLSVAKGRPRDSQVIAELITRLSGGARTPTKDDVMAAFGEKAYMLLQMGDQKVGIAGWQVENLVARTTEFFIDASLPIENALKTLITEVERASGELQCEASLLFLPADLAAHEATWKQLGYEKRTARSLGVQAWTDAAKESAQPNTVLFFKQLRQDRVLRPI